jgi:4-hydroxybenzoate polyprenyltransferase
MVPILVGLYFFQCYQIGNTRGFAQYNYPFEQFKNVSFILSLSFILAAFAFLFNLAREIIKDIEDINGDKILKAKTVPIVLGVDKTKVIVEAILGMAILAIPLLSAQLKFLDKIVLLPFGCAALLALISIALLFRAKEKASYKLINTCLKLAMIFGLLSPVFWKLISIYA